MLSHIGLAWAIAFVAALGIVAVVPTTFATTMILAEGKQATEATSGTDQTDENECDDYRNSPKTSNKSQKRQHRTRINSNKHKHKERLSLLWGEDGSFAIPFPVTKPTTVIKRYDNFWSRFWIRVDKYDNEVEKIFQEEKEKIRETLKKFYRLADPKFARAKLALATRKNRLSGSFGEDGSQDLERISDDGDDELLPGTILEIVNKDDGDEKGDEQPTLLEEHAYVLVERMQLELGATPKHYMDFAYRSVTSSSSASSSSSNSRYSSSSSNDRGADAGDDQWIGDSILIEDQPVCNDITITGTSQEQLNEGERNCVVDRDRTMAFFASWWKWWLPFASSQWWKNYGSTKADYDIGNSPFAGGSNGEVWRGHRICHRAFLNPQHQKTKTDRSYFSNDDAKEEDNDDSEYNWSNQEYDKSSGDKEEREDRHTSYECNDRTPLVLKRLRIERGYLLLEAGLREIYFGKLIARVLEDTKQNMYTVYVDHFFREVPRRQHSRAFGGLPNDNNENQRATDLELWIVYEDAGPSLRSYIYSPIVSESGFVMYQHSKLWTKLRTYADDEEEGGGDDWDSSVEVRTSTDQPGTSKKKASSNKGKNQDRKIGRLLLFLQKILREILSAAAELHKRGIVHRDIKPSNVLCQSDHPLTFEELFESDELPDIQCKLGDFSSGWDRYTSEHLYTKGPTPGEQTDEYAPPESYVGPYWKPFDEEIPQSYDSWSIGVLALELLLGTPNVFSVDQRTNALLTVKLKRARASEDEIAYAMYLAALSNFCIFVPSNETSKGESWPLRYGDPLHKTAMVKESCTLQDFHRALRARDPLGIGFDTSTDLLLHLIWQLLAFDPSERMTAEEALRHPFFISPDGTLDSLHHIPGSHNALISEIFDNRIDFEVKDEIKTFQCPSCGRIFHDWRSCHQHANLRKHAKFCLYNHTVLPSCINTHAMLPEHPTSGYCDLQGRRKTIEDFHSIHLHHEHQFYGIFDGHTGNLASKFAASELYTELLSQLPNLIHIKGKKALNSENDGDAIIDDHYSWKEEIRINVTKAFETVHERFLDRITTMTSAISEVGSAPKMDQSGSTATALLVTQNVVIAAVLGDSRGVLASAKTPKTTTEIDGSESPKKSRGKSKWNNFPDISAIPFSIDHVASDRAERDLVLSRGGFVSKSGDTARVNGTLAITRSIGDANLAPVLSREPHVRVFDRAELRELCGDLTLRDDENESRYSSISANNRKAIPCFAILASDGLWDVMSNQEAVDMVVEIILRHNEAQASGDTTREVALFPSSANAADDDDEENGGPFQESAERLAVEAYVRGSTDNIGVCVVAID